MKFVRLVLTVAVPEEGDLEQIKTALRQAWPALDIADDNTRASRAAPRLLDCVKCGRQFAATRSDAIYCSAACRLAVYASRKAGARR